MANVYAIKSGVWSDTTVWNTGVLPDVVDDVFSNNFTVTIDVSPTVLSIRNTAASPIVAGGGFNLLDGVTLTCTGGGVFGGSLTCITYSGSGSANINGIINNSSASGTYTLVHSGSGILNIVGNVIGTFAAVTNYNVVNVSSGGTLNVIGNVIAQGTQKTVISITNGFLNITGNVEASDSPSNNTIAISATNTIISITGNVSRTNKTTQVVGSVIQASQGSIDITGNIYNDLIAGATNNVPTILTSSAMIIRCIGAIYAGLAANAISSTSISAINIFTGPFVSSTSGAQPLYVNRMHYQRTIGSYFEFRDDSTNGALPPAAPAPATRLVSPETGADLPAQSDVRKGIVYALGTMEGTMNIPDPANVRKDIPVDDTVGTGVLDASGIFDVLTSSLTAPGSIGERLKNVSTVDTTGTQLQNLT